MSGAIGSTPTQIQPNIIQNSVQQNAQKTVQRETTQQQAPNREVAQAQSNQNFQKIAQDIIASRAEAPVVDSGSSQRGQVVDILV
jgi:hypothetical protein